MRQLEIIVEEASMAEALRHLMPRILNNRGRWKPVQMRNKQDLLKKLPSRLRAYRKRIDNGEDLRIIVLVDQDSDDCIELKRRLEEMAREARLFTKTAPDQDGKFKVVNRIVIEELEAWFIGDVEALKAAFNSLRKANFPGSFNNPDNGGTWERFYRFLKRHGIYRSPRAWMEAFKGVARRHSMPWIPSARSAIRRLTWTGITWSTDSTRWMLMSASLLSK